VSILKKFNLIPVPILDVQLSICLARAIIEANNLGVFEALKGNREGLSSEELAQHVAISSEGAAILLNALEKTGYLRSRKGRYKNGPWVNRWITDPQSGISNFLRLQTHTWMRLSDLEVPLRTGRPVKDFHDDEVTLHSERQAIYTNGMREIAHHFISEFVKRVKLPKGAKRLLDIGGAHGDYSRALVRKFPHIKATVFDLPGPISSAQQILKEEGNPEQIELKAGDIFRDDLGTCWDVVLFANIIHLFNLKQNQRLLKRIYDMLNPGGVLLVMDQFHGMGRLHDRIASLISLNFFTAGGKVYHCEEIKDLIMTAGFRKIKIKPFLFNVPTAVFEARK
jgi:SAM-dependent methyltransferase